jgi:hypothetical protein
MWEFRIETVMHEHGVPDMVVNLDSPLVSKVGAIIDSILGNLWHGRGEKGPDGGYELGLFDGGELVGEGHGDGLGIIGETEYCDGLCIGFYVEGEGGCRVGGMNVLEKELARGGSRSFSASTKGPMDMFPIEVEIYSFIIIPWIIQMSALEMVSNDQSREINAGFTMQKMS